MEKNARFWHLTVFFLLMIFLMSNIIKKIKLLLVNGSTINDSTQFVNESVNNNSCSFTNPEIGHII